ncbi:MAG: hypothetical protein Q9160_003689 [Pyrenula sp. 1 TL-2023]
MTSHLHKIANRTLTKPIAVALYLVKYSGAGAISGKYRSDMPKPTKNPCVSRSCHTELLKEAARNPAATMSTPETVIVRRVNNKREILWCHGLVEGPALVGAQTPCSMREITGLMKMLPAMVSPALSEPIRVSSAVGGETCEAGEGTRTSWLEER